MIISVVTIDDVTNPLFPISIISLTLWFIGAWIFIDGLESENPKKKRKKIQTKIEKAYEKHLQERAEGKLIFYNWWDNLKRKWKKRLTWWRKSE